MVIIAQDVEAGAPTDGYLGNLRHQVIGDALSGGRCFAKSGLCWVAHIFPHDFMLTLQLASHVYRVLSWFCDKYQLVTDL